MGRWSQEWNRIPDLGVIPHVVAIPEVVALSGIARLRRCALSDFRVVIVILVVAAAGGGLVVRRGGHASCGPDASGAPKGGHGVVGLEPSLVGQRSLVVTAAGRPLSMMLTIRLGWRNRTAVVEEGSFVVKEGMEGSRPRRRRAVAPLPTPAPWPSLRPGPPVPRLAPVAPYALATFGRIDLPARRLRSSPGDRDRLVTRARRS